MVWSFETRLEEKKESTHLIDAAQARAEPTVHSRDASVDDRGESEMVDKVTCHGVGTIRGCDLKHARTHEEVVCLRTRPADLEELHHVPELAVYVTTDSDGRIDELNIRFLNENLASFDTETLNLFFCNGYAL